MADSFLARAPSSLTVAGLQCRSDTNGVYQVANTIGGKPHWVLMDSFGNAMSHLYAVDEPVEAWVKDNILKLSAKTSNDENNNWNFIKIKNYNRTINLPIGLNHNKIDASMKNGILKIIIEKESMNFDSNIEIN